MFHDREMTTNDRSRPDPEAIVSYITETWPETDVVEAMNAWFFSLDPEKHWPNYATLVTTDEHDEASNLSRPGVFRLNMGVDRETFEASPRRTPNPSTPRSTRSSPTLSTPPSAGSASSTRARRPSVTSSSRS